MQTTMNLKIKFRESFRPFAPAVKRDRVWDFFQLRHDSPYMLLVAPVSEAIRVAVTPGAEGLDKLRQVRSSLPAITHVDYSARVQTVDETHPTFHRLLEKFEKRTGCPVLINTSFNVRGEPIVCTPENAYLCFMATGMDVLVIGRHILKKSRQPNTRSFDSDSYLAAFEVD